MNASLKSLGNGLFAVLRWATAILVGIPMLAVMVVLFGLLGRVVLFILNFGGELLARYSELREPIRPLIGLYYHGYRYLVDYPFNEPMAFLEGYQPTAYPNVNALLITILQTAWAAPLGLGVVLTRRLLSKTDFAKRSWWTACVLFAVGLCLLPLCATLSCMAVLFLLEQLSALVNYLFEQPPIEALRVIDQGREAAASGGLARLPHR